MNAVPPARQRESLDRDVLAPDEDPIGCRAWGLDHCLSLAVESNPDDLGGDGHVLAAGSTHQYRIPWPRQLDFFLDFSFGITIDREDCRRSRGGYEPQNNSEQE